MSKQSVQKIIYQFNQLCKKVKSGRSREIELIEKQNEYFLESQPYIDKNEQVVVGKSQSSDFNGLKEAIEYGAGLINRYIQENMYLNILIEKDFVLDEPLEIRNANLEHIRITSNGEPVNVDVSGTGAGFWFYGERTSMPLFEDLTLNWISAGIRGIYCHRGSTLLCKNVKHTSSLDNPSDGIDVVRLMYNCNGHFRDCIWENEAGRDIYNRASRQTCLSCEFNTPNAEPMRTERQAITYLNGNTINSDGARYFSMNGTYMMLHSNTITGNGTITFNQCYLHFNSPQTFTANGSINFSDGVICYGVYDNRVNVKPNIPDNSGNLFITAPGNTAPNTSTDNPLRDVATIPSGSTTVTVPHAQLDTPTQDEFLVGFVGNPDAANKVWISNVTDTDITIVVDTAPGSDIEVVWQRV